ncbi:MAG: hypothetical protein PHN41_04230 [Bacteroidales bacterium]|jgi:hypothetical protein|nr:hypothetical protein [Bacteroidales bacterium]MDD4702720.1 hypothetical protein [Bacteroidales bacterium]MDX9797811.1 hypothetical protein [Bacteroidales bacterium]
MDREQLFAKKLIFLLNPLFLSVYAFAYYLILFLLFSAIPNSLSLVMKSFTLYVLVSCLLPILILFLLNGSSFEDFLKNSEESNSSYIVVASTFFISYIYFSILNVSTWFEMGLLIPIYAVLVQMPLRRRMDSYLDIILLGAITFFVFILTIEFYYVLSIYPFLIAILLSGLLSYAYQIQGILTSKTVVKNYLIGCLISVFIFLFVLIV